MAREPELGIKVKVEPQISATDITNAVEKVTPDGGVPIKVKISNVKQAMSSFAADQKKDSSSWPLINVKINNAKEALDNAFKKISTEIDVNISDASVSNIKTKLKDALKDVSVNANVATKTPTGSIKNPTSKPRTLNVTTSQLSSTATQLGKLEEKVNAIENADLTANFSKAKTDFDNFVNSADHSLATFTSIKATIGSIEQQVASLSSKTSKTISGDSLKVTSSQITSTATQLGKLEERINALGDENLSAAFSKAKSDFDAFVNSADHSITTFTNLKTAIGNLEQQVSQTPKTSEVSDASILKDYESSINRIIKLQQELSKISSEQSPAAYDLTNTKLIQEQTNLEQLKQAVEARSLTQQQQYINSNNLYEKSIQAITEALNQRRVAEQQAAAATDSDSTSIQKKINRLNGYVNALQKAGISDPKIYNSINQELDLANNFLSAIRESGNIDVDAKRFFDERDISGINGFRSGVDYIESRVANINALVNDALDTRRIQNASTQANTMLQNLRSTVSDYLSKNGNILNTDLASDFFGLENGLNADNAASNIRELQNTFSTLRAQAKSLGLETEGLTQKFTNLFSEHFATGLTMTALHTMENSLQVILQYVIDIDTAMTELKKVTNETAEGYEQYMNRASDVANDLGVSLTDYINSTSEWARLGYDLDQSEELARMSTLLANVGDGIQNAADASSYLISIIQGFHLDTSEVEHVVDVMNEVANTQPIDAEGIAEILTRSAASLSEAGNTLEESIALGTAAFATTQNAERTGNALKSISLFLRAAKTDAEAAGLSVDGMANSVSELREEVMQLTGIDIMADSAGTTFKSTYQILKEISEVYNDLTDVDQANLTELLAGKYNANILSSLLSDFSLAEDSLKSANEAAGSAMRENEVYLDSIQGSINRFIAAFQNMSNTILDSGFVKGIVDIGTAIINLTDSIIGFTGAAPAFATAIASFGTIKAFAEPVQEISQLLELARTNTEQQVGYIVSAGQRLSSIPSALRGYETLGIKKVDMSGYSEGSQQITDFIMKLANLDEQQRSTSMSLVNLTGSQTEYINTMVKSIQTGEAVSGQAYMNQLNSMNLDAATKQNIMSTLGLSDAYGKYNVVSAEVIKNKLADSQVTALLGTETANSAKNAVTATVAMQGQVVATQAVTNAQRTLNVVMAAGKQLLMSFAIGAIVSVIQAAAEAIGNYIHRLESANEALENASTEYDNVTESVESLKDQLAEVNKSIKDIQGSGELSLTDKEDLANLREEKELLEMQLELEKMKAEVKAQEVANDAVDAAQIYDDKNNSVGVSISDVAKYEDQDIGNYFGSNELPQMLAEYQKLVELRDEAFGDPELYNQYNSQLTEVKGNIVDIYEQLMNYKDGLDTIDYEDMTQEQKEMYDAVKQSIESILYYTDKEYYIRIKIEADGYEDARKEIIKYAQDNGVTTVDELSYKLGNLDWSSNVTQFLTDMQAAGIGTESIAASMIDSINGVSDSLENAGDSADGFSLQITEQFKDLDEIKDAYKDVRDAIEEYNRYGIISSDTLQALTTLDSKYTDCLYDENGQLNINSGTLSKVTSSYVTLTDAVYENIKALEIKNAIDQVENLKSGEQAKQILEEAEATKNATDEYDATIAGFEQAVADKWDELFDEDTSITAAYKNKANRKFIEEYFAGIEEQLKQSLSNINEAQKSSRLNLDKHLGYTSPSDNDDDDDKDTKKIMDAVGAWSTLSKAMDEYNKTGSISYETLDSLIGLDARLTGVLQQQGDQLVINADAFRDLIQNQLKETVAAEDATNTAAELARMLDWVDQNAVDGTLSLDELRNAIEGVDAAMDKAQEESTTYAEAISGLYNVFASRVPGENFTLDQINQIEDYLQTIRKYGENPFTFDVETGEFSVNYDSIRNVLEGQYKDLVEQATAAGDTMGEALYGALLESVQNQEVPLLDLSSEDNNVLNQFINQSNKFKDGYTLLTEAVDEYNQHHEITSETYANLMKVMPEYQKYLTIENGRMKMNTQAFKDDYLAILNQTIAILEADGANAELVESLKKVRDGLGNLEYWFTGSTATVDKFKNAMSQLVSVINKVLDAIGENLQDNANKLQIWGEAIQDEIDDRIDALEDQKDALEDMYDDQIDDLEDQKDTLEKVNDEQERAIKLAQLQDALERARTAKTVRKYVEGQGYIWTTDDEAIRDAEKDLSDQLRDWNQEDANNAIEEEIENIKNQQQEATDAIDAQIDKLQELKDKYSEILDLIGMDWDDYQEMLKAQAAAQGMTIDEMEAYLGQYKDSVTENMQEIDRVTDTQEQIQGIQDFIETLKDVWEIISVILDILDVLGGGGGILGALKKVIGNIFGGEDELEGEGEDKESTSNIFTNLVDGAKNFFGNLKTKFQEGWDNILEGASEFNWNVWQKITGFFGDTKAGVDSFISGIKSFFTNGWDNITNGAHNFIQGLIQKFTGEGFPTVSGSVSDFIQNITGFFSNGFPNLTNIANNFINSLTGFFSNGFGGILSTVSGWIGNLGSLFSSGLSGIASTVTSVLSSLGGGSILAGAGTVGAVAVGGMALNGVVSSVADYAQGKADQAAEDGKALQSIGWNALSSIANAAISPVGTIIKGIKNLFGFKSGTTGVAKSGVYRVDEAGPELIVRSPQAGRLAYLQAGDGVIPADITSRLFELGADPEAWIRKHADQQTVVVESHDSGSTVLTIGDININQPVGDADQLARIFVQQLPNKIKQELNKR